MLKLKAEPLTPAQGDVAQHHTATLAAWQLQQTGKLPETTKHLIKACVPSAIWRGALAGCKDPEVAAGFQPHHQLLLQDFPPRGG